MLRAIEGNPIRWLNLSMNNLTDKDAKAIAELIQNNAVLIHVDLSNNRIAREGMKDLSTALSNNKTVTHLNVSNNLLQDKGAARVGELLANNSTITSINVNSNHISPTGLTNLSANLVGRSEVNTSISLADNNIAQENVIRFAKVLKCNPKVQSINCTDKELELNIHAQKLFDTIIKIRDSDDNVEEHKQQLNKLIWDCVVPHPRWQEVFESLVTESDERYPFNVSTLDKDGKSLVNNIGRPALLDFLFEHGYIPHGNELVSKTLQDTNVIKNKVTNELAEDVAKELIKTCKEKGLEKELEDFINGGYKNCQSLTQQKVSREFNRLFKEKISKDLPTGAEYTDVMNKLDKTVAVHTLSNPIDPLTQAITNDTDIDIFKKPENFNTLPQETTRFPVNDERELSFNTTIGVDALEAKELLGDTITPSMAKALSSFAIHENEKIPHTHRPKQMQVLAQNLEAQQMGTHLVHDNDVPTTSSKNKQETMETVAQKLGQAISPHLAATPSPNNATPNVVKKHIRSNTLV